MLLHVVYAHKVFTANLNVNTELGRGNVKAVFTHQMCQYTKLSRSLLLLLTHASYYDLILE